MTDDEQLVTIVVGEPESAPAHSPQQWTLDQVCADAVEAAHQALLDEVDPSQIGEHLGQIAEGPLVVTHYFAGHVPGYVGWRWAVTVTRAPDADAVTIDETALLPDEHALLAPAWVPWKHRIESGDVGAGDVLVTDPDDQRLVAGLTDNDLSQDQRDDLAPPEWELGLGRKRMLSPQGRREAAHRWYREVGPRSQIARAADLHCQTCGFLLLIGGPMGQAFGVCANGFSPVDGHIVAMDFGCGAHSETQERPNVPVAQIVVDELGYEPITVQTADDEPEPAELEPAVGAEGEEPAAQEQVPTAEPEADCAEGDETLPDGEPAQEHETMQEKQTEEGS